MKDSIKNFPLVSVVIASRNEEKYIGKCLSSLIKQDYPKEKMEVLIVDGMSVDKTREVIENFKFENSNLDIKLLENAKKSTPFGMNIGVKNAKGEIIVLVNAHSILDKEFLKWSIYFLKKIKETDAVGGRLSAIGHRGTIAKTIALISDSVFGSGGIRYRQREKEGFVNDTLPYCAYRREVFKRIGLIDESLIRGNDAEFNLRLLKNKGKIYFSPKIKSYLYSRSSLQKFCKQQFQYGYFKVKIAQKLGWRSILRQTIPGVFVFSLILTGIFSFFLGPFSSFFLLILGTYFLMNIFFSFQIAFQHGMKFFFPCLFLFFVLHFSYGLGFLKGILDFLVFKKKIRKDIRITR